MKIAETYIRKTLIPNRDQGMMLRHAVDKLLPNPVSSFADLIPSHIVIVFAGSSPNHKSSQDILLDRQASPSEAPSMEGE